jgi:RNA polymerase sigma-70 factor (ECF subfamily)
LDEVRTMDAQGEIHRRDEQFVADCLNGHPEQYRQLAERYQGVLRSHLTRELRDRDEAEEAAQEALVRAYFWLPNLRNRSSFFSWLIGIANRVAQEHRRSRQRDRRITVAAADRAARRDQLSDSEHQATAALDEALQEAIASLPEQQRQVVLLRYYAPMSCKAIAEQLDMPLGSVTKTLSRAYLALRERLERAHKTSAEVSS